VPPTENNTRHRQRRSRARATAVTLLAIAGWLGPAAARADAVRVQFSTRVATGERPRLTVIADQAVDAVDVELRAEGAGDDGRGGAGGARPVNASLGPLARGARREVPLDAGPGRHRWKGRLQVRQGAKVTDSTLEFETVVAPRLEIAIDKARVDLGGRRLEARFNRPAARAEVKVYGATGGAPLVEAEQALDGAPPGTALVIGWPAEGAPAAAEVGRIDLTLHDVDGFFAGVSLYPWSVYIPHEEVSFATDSAAITAGEQPKLEASLARIAEALARHKDLGPIKLFIAGHTDTVGKPAYNVALSQRRAQAIAGWFRKRGLRLPIFYEGFGEHAPLVATRDETDEARNRRVDYILAVEEPALKATQWKPGWKRLP
jgi:outer membrane protein OmpA-like peptidoglycan-associated protein